MSREEVWAVVGTPYRYEFGENFEQFLEYRPVAHGMQSVFLLTVSYDNESRVATVTGSSLGPPWYKQVLWRLGF
jgi:hypothetical protein